MFTTSLLRFKYVLKFMSLQASLNLSSIWGLRRFDKLIREALSFWHISDKNAIGFSQMKWHYDPDKILYDSHSISQPPDFHIFCKMSVYLRFLCGVVIYFVFHYDIGMPSVSFSIHQVAIHRNNVIVWNLFCAAQVFKCYFAITGKQTRITIVPKFKYGRP